MFARLFLTFTIMSLVEIFVLVQVGGVLGGWMTIGLVIITALVGASLVRSQGVQTAMTVQQRMAQGEMPGQQIMEGLLLVIAGVLLVTPGFITDTLGMVILTPVSRGWLAKQLMAKASVHFTAGGTGFQGGGPRGFEQNSGFSQPFQDERGSPNDPSRPAGGNTYEGDYERKD